MRTKLPLSKSDQALLLRDAERELLRYNRRAVLRQGLSLGSLVLLSGCKLVSDDFGEGFLRKISRFNDDVQAALFSPTRLAPTFPRALINKPFRFNAFYDRDEAPEVDDDYQLTLSGMIADKKPWTVQALLGLKQEAQITRHVCVEGWSQIGEWEGVPLKLFLERVGADLTAKYVGFKCFDDYYESIDMPSALHPQTILSLKFEGEPTPLIYGAPVRLRIPTKLGYKSAKHVAEIFVSNSHPGGYWEDQGYNWFGGS